MAGAGRPACELLSGERRLSAEALQEQSVRAAAGLAALSVGAGDRVAYLLRNDFASFVVHQAAQLIGFDAVPINWHLLAGEVRYILEDCNARAILIHEDLLDESMAAALTGRVVLVVDVPAELALAYPGHTSKPALAENYLRWDDWVASQSPLSVQPTRVVPPLFYTSGTSGTPKAVVRKPLAPELGAAIAARTRFAWGFDEPGIRSVMTGPLYHSAPNGYAHMVLAAGELLVLQPRFDGEDLLRLIERHRISHLHLVPTMFVRLLALPQQTRQRYDLSSLRCITHGAAPCPPAVKRSMIDWLGECINEYYAMTETGIIACSSSSQWLSHPGSVGRAAPGVEIQIRDDNGHNCETRQTGNICVRHEGTDAIEYGNDVRKTQALWQAGFLITGDVGFLDEDGFLYLTDRKSDLIISAGVNIYPAEVEAALSSMPGVEDVVVLGLPHADLGEQVVAVLQMRQPVPAQAVLDFLGEHVARYKIPRRIEFMENIPREDSGKVKKGAVAALFSESIEAP